MNFLDRDNISLENVNISILGAGRSGYAAAELIDTLGGNPFISEFKSKTDVDLAKFNHELGGHSLNVLDCDLMVISPGISDKIDIVKQAKLNDIPIVSEIELASWFTNSPILAITGSNGKTTTTMLLYQMCIEAGLNSEIVGNIGIPFSHKVNNEIKGKINPEVYVMEVSSFQLEHIIHFSPKVSSIINLQPDHLDRYDNFQNYINAKINITKNIKESDFFIYNSDDEVLNKFFKNSSKNYIPFSLNMESRAPFNSNDTKVYYYENNIEIPLYYFDESKLVGSHNIQNILSAAIMAHSFKIPISSISKAILDFEPIPHRIEFSGNINGTAYYNDSKATNLDSVKVALNSFDRLIILILGGKNKGEIYFNNLVELNNEKVKKVICYGESGEYIFNQLDKINSKEYFKDFSTAVKMAIKSSNEGDIVLLSPGCTSFDQFSNFEERGNMFKKIINDYLN
tara:strand:+ start:1888 stop:3255 length:1368 start_codon:yes stop_codon:yes gene_type:complete